MSVGLRSLMAVLSGSAHGPHVEVAARYVRGLKLYQIRIFLFKLFGMEVSRNTSARALIGGKKTQSPGMLGS